MLRIFVVNTGLALAATMLLAVFGETPSFSGIAVSWVYANAIGLPAAYVMPRFVFAIEPFHPWVRWLLIASALTLLAVLGSYVAGAIFYLVSRQTGSFSSNHYRVAFGIGLRISVCITLVFGLVASAFGRITAQRERALKVAAEARLSSLESRLHPHFLFNTLNSISALVREDPNRAERMIEQIAAILRYSLDANPSRLVPLQQELKIVTDYLEIEKARFGDRLRYRLDVPAQLESLPVPPFALQVLVENSVKYAVAPRREGGTITVTVRRAGANAELEVADDGPGFDPSHLPHSHALDTLRSRLETHFSGAARLTVTRLPRGVSVKVTLP